jgi:glutathione S-transferase
LPELYDHILSDRCYTVRLTLSLLGVACMRKTVDYAPAKMPASAAVLSLNPAGDIPVFVDGDVVLTDVKPILMHLAAHYDTTKTWQADDAEVVRWVDFSVGPLAVLSDARRVTLFSAEGDRDALVKESRVAMRAVEDQLTDQTLAGQKFIASARPSIADIAVFPAIMLSHDCGIGHEDYPAINLWQRQIRRLPGFISTPGIPDYF